MNDAAPVVKRPIPAAREVTPSLKIV